MKKKIITGIILGVVLLSLFAMAAYNNNKGAAAGLGKGKIGVIYIDGPILAGRSSSGLFGYQSGADDIMRNLRIAGEDPSVEAVILRINSPGGSAAASQEIAQEVQRLRENGKTVVVSMADVAASGAYWIAAVSDRIVANPSTTTGSIGVIIDVQNLTGLYEKLGVEFNNIKSGPHKDMGSSNRPLTQEEELILQDMVDDIYDQFVEVVVEGRNMEKEKVLEIADGRVFTGRQAWKLGLVDDLGNFYDSVEITARLADLKGKPELIEIGTKSFWSEFIGGAVCGVYNILRNISALEMEKLFYDPYGVGGLTR